MWFLYLILFFIICWYGYALCTGNFVKQVKATFDGKAFRRRLWMCAVLLDIWANVVFFNGAIDETMSSRIYRAYAFNKKPLRFEVFLYHFVNLLFSWEPNHCLDAYNSTATNKYFNGTDRFKNKPTRNL